MSRAVAMLLIGGCAADPVANCTHFPQSDCCETNDQCQGFYGAEFRYCSHPERENGGTCSECTLDRHCEDGQECDLSGKAHQGVCLDLG